MYNVHAVLEMNEFIALYQGVRKPVAVDSRAEEDGAPLVANRRLVFDEWEIEATQASTLTFHGLAFLL